MTHDRFSELPGLANMTPPAGNRQETQVRKPRTGKPERIHQKPAALLSMGSLNQLDFR